mgnify:CR=1 FL=1
MSRTVTIQDATRNFAGLIDSIAQTEETVIVDDGGDAVAVVLSPHEFLKFRRERAWALIRRVQDRNAHLDPDDVLTDVTNVVEEVRQEQYDRRRSSATRGA